MNDLDRGRRWLGRAGGLYLVGASLFCAALSWVPLHFLAGLVADPPYPRSEIPDFVAATVRGRAAVPLLAMPAFACGCILLTTRWRPKLTVSAGSLLLLLPVVVVGYCFVRLIAPMYTYQTI